MLEMLDVLYNNYISIRSISENNSFQSLIGNELEEYKIIFLNKKIYNTDYYDKLLDKDIYYFNTVESENENKIKIKDALESNKILYINNSKLFFTFPDINNYDKTVDELDTTIIYIYIIMKIYNIRIKTLSLSEDNILTWKKMMENIPKDNIKSVRLVNYYNKTGGNIYKNLSHVPNNFSSLSQDKITEIIKNNEIVDYIVTEFMKTNNKYIEKNPTIEKNRTEESDKNETKIIIQSTIDREKEKINNYIKSLNELIIKFTNKLGIKNNTNNENTATIESEKTYSKFLLIIKSTEIIPTISNNSEITIGNKRPRVDDYKNKLIRSVNILQKFKENINYWNSIKTDLINDNINEETRALFEIGNILNNRIQEGLNSYISVLPIVFYACEFPSNIYKNDNCYVTYKYNDNTELVSYIKKTECAPNSYISEYMNDVNNVKNYNYHAAFFNSNGKNNTINLINDKVIGLNKLIESTNEQNRAINKIINMMFLVGVSGTGKSTRVFGATDKKAAEGDKVGIVTNIIKKAISDGSTVSIGYFVCYGRKINNESFKEMLLFFNKQDSAEIFIPYTMENTTNRIKNNYSDFYVNIVNKKLHKQNYDESLKFIKGDDSININTTDNKNQTIRDILEKSQDNIWTSIIPGISDIETNDTLTKLFDYYLNKQKEIYTVLPTKNNIESSRGHTCVLIRITDTSQNHKYFPLFDMAGKEDPEAMEKFFFKNDT